MDNIHERDAESSERRDGLASFSSHLSPKFHNFKDAKFHADLAIYTAWRFHMFNLTVILCNS